MTTRTIYPPSFTLITSDLAISLSPACASCIYFTFAIFTNAAFASITLSAKFSAKAYIHCPFIMSVPSKVIVSSVLSTDIPSWYKLRSSTSPTAVSATKPSSATDFILSRYSAIPSSALSKRIVDTLTLQACASSSSFKNGFCFIFLSKYSWRFFFNIVLVTSSVPFYVFRHFINYC